MQGPAKLAWPDRPARAESGQETLSFTASRFVMTWEVTPGSGMVSVGAVATVLSPAHKSPACLNPAVVDSLYSFVVMYVGAMLAMVNEPESEKGTTTVIRSGVAAAVAPAKPPPNVTTGLSENLSNDVDAMEIVSPPMAV